MDAYRQYYKYKLSKISVQEYNMLLSKDTTIIKMTILKILNDNYGNIDS